MKENKVQNPKQYQDSFCTQIGLEKIKEQNQFTVWQKGENQICFLGNGEDVQTGIGNYTIPKDFLIEYEYQSEYLHFGMIHQGISYSVSEEMIEVRSMPSSFLTLEKTTVGANRWKEGQKFQGVEVSIEVGYLKNEIFPFLGIEQKELEILEENKRYTKLSIEVCRLLLKIENLLQKQEMTRPLQKALCAECVALIFQGNNRTILKKQNKNESQYILLGERQIKFSKEDFQKIKQARMLIKTKATQFMTIYEISKQVGLSEQKLKIGFKQKYRQTIWDFANEVRMNYATALLCETEENVLQISQKVGYQSQTAFIQAFKNWYGMTPTKYRKQRG